MSIIRIAAHLLVKNEEDIIKECIDHVSIYCNYIFVIDNGSDDSTFEICKNHPKVNYCERIDCTYSDALRQQLMDVSKQYLRPNIDWYLALSADHFFSSDPRDDIQKARDEKANVITYDVAQFYLTDKDLAEIQHDEHEWERADIESRLKYYAINYGNFPVAFQYDENAVNNDEVTEWPEMNDIRKASFKPILKHYQFRSIPQLKKRLNIRQQQIAKGFNGFRHYRSFDWRDYIFNSSKLHCFSGEWERTKRPSLDDLLGYKISIMEKVCGKIRGFLRRIK